MIFVSIFRSVENYKIQSTTQEGFNANAFFHSVGNFVKIFFGAFGIGSALGCVNALISFVSI